MTTEPNSDTETFETLLSKFHEINLRGQRLLNAGASAHVLYQTLLEAQEIQRRAHGAYYQLTRNEPKP